MIIAKDIVKSFGSQSVLKGVSAEFEDGQTNLVIGRSGAGKTVFLKILVSLFKPDSGKVWYDGVCLTDLNAKELKEIRKQVGMLFQGSALFDSLSVEQNVMFPLDMFTNQTQKEKLQRVNYCLERVGLGGANKKFPSELSGGMQKRVGIARAIVLNPKYLFCDEPNSGLDPKTALVIDELIRDITIENNITTIINTHDMNSVMEIGDNIFLLKDGLLVWHGTKDDVLTTTNKDMQDFFFASPFLRRMREKAYGKF